MTPIDLAALRRFAFLTLPNYSMIACANAIEVLRMANRLGGTPIYEWQVVTPDGLPAAASNGLALHPTVPIPAMRRPDLFLACGGVDVREAVSAKVKSALRRLARDNVPLGGLCTGTFALAAAGLLHGHRCAIHWENLAAIEQEFPDVDFTDDLYTVDGDRVTCTGGVAPLSLMLAVVEGRLGAAFSESIAAQFLVERTRAGAESQQRPAGPAGYGKLGEAVRLMRHAIDSPPQAATVACAVGLSSRQLERLFRQHLGTTPAAYSAGLRLDRARTLLRETGMAVTAIAAACGYNAPSRLSAAYRARFGHSPTAERAPPRKPPHAH